MYNLKKFGQHFLINKNVLYKIVKVTNIEGKNLLEVGGGTGNLSRFILKEQPKSLIIFEIDKILVDKLQNDLVNDMSNECNLQVLSIDCLKTSPTNLDLIISNLPYNIATKFIMHAMLTYGYKEMVLMVQKEMADQWVGDPLHNFMSILIQSCHKLKRCFNVAAKDFIPKPKVESTVVYLEKIKELNLNLIKILAAFQNRRKKLGNTIPQYFQENCHKDLMIFKIIETFKNKRPEELSVKDWNLFADNLK